MTDHFFRRTGESQASRFKEQRGITQTTDCLHVVAHEQHRAAFAPRDFPHLSQAFLLKLGVTDSENFVNNQNFRVQMCSNSERQADIHSRRVAFYRSVDVSLDSGKIDNLVELAPYLRFRHSKNCAVKENVFPAGQLGMKPSSDFQQARDAAFHPNFAPCRRRYSRQDFQKRAFACAVSADYSKNFALLDLKRDPAQRPDFVVGKRAIELSVISYFFSVFCRLPSDL